jgi:hypothetical protein
MTNSNKSLASLPQRSYAMDISCKDPKVRSRFLGDVRPASMLLVVPELARPEFVLEIEAYAAKS